MIITCYLYLISPDYKSNSQFSHSVFIDESTYNVPTFQVLESKTIEESMSECLKKYFDITPEWIYSTSLISHISKDGQTLHIHYTMQVPELKSSKGKFFKITDFSKFEKVLNTLRKINVV